MSRSLLKDNLSSDNGADGFILHGGSENVFQGNRSTGNGTYGFVLSGDGAATTDNTVARNQASDNGFEGIALVFGASYNEVFGNISQRERLRRDLPVLRVRPQRDPGQCADWEHKQWRPRVPVLVQRDHQQPGHAEQHRGAREPRGHQRNRGCEFQ